MTSPPRSLPDVGLLVLGVFWALLIGVALLVGLLTGSGTWGACVGLGAALLWLFLAHREWPERQTTER